MASTESTTNLSSVLASLSETLGEFRTESAEIESKFFELVGGIGELVPANAAVNCVEPAGLESTAVERLESLDRSISEQRVEFSGKQDQLTDDVGQLRELVDRQVQLFTALFSSTAKINKESSSRTGNKKNSSEDEVLNDVFAQFEELRGAAADVNTVSKA